MEREEETTVTTWLKLAARWHYFKDLSKVKGYVHHACVQYPQEPEEGTRYPRPGVTGNGEPPDMAAWNQTQVFWESGKHS